MAITLRKYVTLTTLLFLFLFLHSILPPSVVTAQDQIPANPSSVNQWLYANFNSYKQKMSEISKPDDANLNASLLAAVKNTTFITVQQDGKGDFATIKAAVASVPVGNTKRVVIKIGPGVYKEKVTIEWKKNYITFLGSPNAMPTISFGGTADHYGTADSATVIVISDYFIASNIIFENSTPKPVAGVRNTVQAVAFRIWGDRGAFYNCKFYGYQDTLLDEQGMHFFKDCLIRGTIDFIFGNGRSIYLNCQIESIADGGTWITAEARSTASNQGGFSIIHSKITGSGDAYLGRAWKPYSRVVISYTYMDTLVNPKGWHNHDYPSVEKSVYYGEYQNKGPGAATDQRVGWSKKLSSAEAKPFISMSYIKAKEWLLLPPK